MNKQDVRIKRYFFTDLLSADKYIMGFVTDLQSMGDDEWERTFGKAFHLDEFLSACKCASLVQNNQ